MGIRIKEKNRGSIRRSRKTELHMPLAVRRKEQGPKTNCGRPRASSSSRRTLRERGGILPRCQKRLSPKREQEYAPLMMAVVKNAISGCKEMVRGAVGESSVSVLCFQEARPHLPRFSASSPVRPTNVSALLRNADTSVQRYTDSASCD
jgi:hypothetical protein